MKTKWLGLSWHLQPWFANLNILKDVMGHALTKKYFMKTNTQRNFFLFIKIKITNCTWKPNIFGSPDTYNLDLLLNYDLKDVIEHAWPKNTSWKLICKEIPICSWNLKLQIIHKNHKSGALLTPTTLIHLNVIWFKSVRVHGWPKNYFMKTNMQRKFFLLIKLRTTNCTWKPNIFGSPDSYNLDPLINYGWKNMIGYAWPKNTSWKLIC